MPSRARPHPWRRRRGIILLLLDGVHEEGVVLVGPLLAVVYVAEHELERLGAVGGGHREGVVTEVRTPVAVLVEIPRRAGAGVQLARGRLRREWSAASSVTCGCC